jgi:methyl-accepting chemotaxis protein
MSLPVASLFGRFRRSLAGRRAHAPGPAPAPQDYALPIEASVRLDQEFGARLESMVERTEASAIAIMGQVRGLCDESSSLVERLQGAAVEAAAVEEELACSMSDLAGMARFLQELPERLERDMHHIDQIAGEIRSLSGLAESVRTIAMQSHLLSVNAAIEASRAGPAGAAFRVVADEVRVLAANSDAAAARIGGSLARSEALLREGLGLSAHGASAQCAEIADNTRAVLRLQTNLERLTGSYRARFDEVADHGQMVAAGAAEVLGQLQYQDIVRQCVERLQAAATRRNAALGLAFSAATPDPEALARLLGDVLDEYLAGEAMHGLHSHEGTAGEAAIELF